jgi:enoyl-[acyl-carrier protein] reductase III
VAICVTGGSSGLGRAIAERFATPGNDVFINYHSDDGAAEETAAAVQAAGARAHLLKIDVTSAEGARELAAAVSARVGHLDQLVHGAAKTVSGPLLEATPEELEDAIRLNGLALVHLTRELLPVLGEGSTVFYLTSRGARRVIPGYGSLGAAKALAEHLVRYLAVEVAGRGIRVNSISPGAVDTRAFRAMFPGVWQERLAAAANANPAGRGVTVEDAADLVEALSRPEFAMVKGQTISVDGGVSLM